MYSGLSPPRRSRARCRDVRPTARSLPDEDKWWLSRRRRGTLLAAMIVSASYKTDIPAFYGKWFRTRLEAGYVRVANPYGGPPQLVPLDRQNVDGFVFWTRNVEPFWPVLEQVGEAGFPFLVQYTATGYPRLLDAGTPAAEAGVNQLRRIARVFGDRVAVWRYDPILVTSLSPLPWHIANFQALCAALSGAVDEVIVSFAHIYRKTRRNLDVAARTFGFCWRDPPADEKRWLLSRFAKIAAKEAMLVRVCGQAENLVEGVGEARCIDAERLSAIAGRAVFAPRQPHRRGCGCWSSKDIGAYDTCPHGCVYCYAVNSRQRAKRHLQCHDPSAANLSPLSSRPHAAKS